MTIDHIKDIRKLLNSFLSPNLNSNTKYRIIGYLEAILVYNNKLKPGENFDFQEVTYIERKHIGYLFNYGPKIEKKRKETHLEHIIRLTDELINELKNV